VENKRRNEKNQRSDTKKKCEVITRREKGNKVNYMPQIHARNGMKA
jgi:hypothetical protein